METKNRLYRFNLKVQNLEEPSFACFMGYEWSELSRAQCDVFEAQRSSFELRMENTLLSYHHEGNTLIQTGPNTDYINRRALDYGTQGEVRFFGESLFSKLDMRWKPNSHLGLRASVLGGQSFEEEKLFGQVQEASAELGWKSFIFSFGRQPLYWGQSFVSPLILGDSAPNMDMLRVSTQSFRGPSFFQHLGTFKVEGFIARMEENRSPPRDWMFGWRVGLKPSPRLEINFGYLYQMWGEGIDKKSWKDYVAELFGARRDRFTNDPKGSDATNRSASMDLRWQFLEGDWPTAFYTEQHLEDCCGSMKTILTKSYNYLYGFENLATPWWGRPLIQMEYVKTTYALYRHHRWRSGTSRLGQLMGHPIGRDAQGIYFHGKTTAFSEWNAGLSFSVEEILRTGRYTHDNYINKTQREKSLWSYSLSPSFLWKFSPDYELQSQLGLIATENKNYQDAERDLEWMTGIRLHAQIF